MANNTNSSKYLAKDKEFILNAFSSLTKRMTTSELKRNIIRKAEWKLSRNKYNGDLNKTEDALRKLDYLKI